MAHAGNGRRWVRQLRRALEKQEREKTSKEGGVIAGVLYMQQRVRRGTPVVKVKKHRVRGSTTISSIQEKRLRLSGEKSKTQGGGNCPK